MPLQWIVFTALLIVFAIFAAVTTYWPDIVAQPPSAAAFLGALAGAGGGLLAIIMGALLNAELNRRRDDRLRGEEGRALALALRGEMLAIVDTFERHKDDWSEAFQGHADDAETKIMGLSVEFPCSTAIFSKNSDRLGLLEDPELIADLAQFYPTLPTEFEFEERSVGYFREIFQSRKKLDDVTIERATGLAEELKAAADRLAPRP